MRSLRNRARAAGPPIALLLGLAGCELAGGAAPAASSHPVRPAEEAALLHAVLRAADARDVSDAGLRPIHEALRSPSPEVRRLAVNALGRFEDPVLVETIAPLLEDSAGEVRAEAANALGQAVHRQDPSGVRPLLLGRVDVETDAFARGVVGQTLGRLRTADAATMRATASALISLSRMNGSNAPAATLIGVVKGYHHLLRQPGVRDSLPETVPARLRELMRYTSDGDSLARLEAERIRGVAAAALVLARAVQTADVASMSRDPAALVRREAVLGALVLPDTAEVRRALLRALEDPSPAVRIEALRAWARGGLASTGCEPILPSLEDDATAVVLQTLDVLPSCAAPAAPSPRIIALADALPAGAGSAWHVPAQALHTLARIAPDSARPRTAALARHESAFARAWAARTAALAADTATLRALSADSAAIVRTAAVSGLHARVGRAADGVAIAALGASDGELVMTAARLLEGTRDTSAAPALLDALDRLSADRRETSRDPRLAILERLAELARPGDTVRLAAYLRDFDPVVARRAADIIAVHTGRAVDIAPNPVPALPVPSPTRLDSLAATTVVFEMDNGDTIAFVLRPWTVPTNVDRFVRLAGSGWFDGLTFHRVVPNFVVQGGSPGANEYAGDGPFTRDELGIHGNWRGSIGLSTRGRDTGDGQLYINLVDNIRLDHDYTVFGHVASDMTVVDRLLEGARIRRATVRARESH